MPLFGRTVSGYWGGTQGGLLCSWAHRNAFSPYKLEILAVNNMLLDNYKWESPALPFSLLINRIWALKLPPWCRR